MTFCLGDKGDKGDIHGNTNRYSELMKIFAMQMGDRKGDVGDKVPSIITESWIEIGFIFDVI